ncbi:MAG: HEPN domain-containing protein [Cyanobacteria bacterium J06614_10]
MKPITQEWINKAEGDFATAHREIQVKTKANYDAVCFHAQQCAEKYLKGYLQELDIHFDRTHELTVLLDSVLRVQPEWESLRSRLKLLTEYAVQYRYPGESATKKDAEKALGDCLQVRQVISKCLLQSE